MTEAARKIFVDSWHVYKKVVSENLMFHREIAAALNAALKERFGARPIAFLDLGCGDAATLAPVLQGVTLSRYTGVDLSPTALALAAQTLETLGAPVELVEADFLDALQREDRFDVVYSSFALHHLTTAQKAEFFRRAARRLAPGGLLLLVDVAREEDETLPVYHAHYTGWLRASWPQLEAAEREAVCDHILACDMPEPLSVLRAQAESAGLALHTAGLRHSWHHFLSFAPRGSA
jgi:ubiquinone/menaquinone biosynthesis C-methylase UbiE